MMLCFLAAIVLTERYNLFTTSTSTQLISDVVADGSALAGVTPIGYDEDRMKDMAQQLISENQIDGANISYDIDVESEYDNRGVPTNNKLVSVKVDTEQDYFVPNFLSHGERFIVTANSVVRVETPTSAAGVLSCSFMTNYRMTLPFATSSIGHRNGSYVTWFINFYLSPEYNDLYKMNHGTTYQEQFLTDYAVCMGFDKFRCYQIGNGGWENYLKSSTAQNDGWFKCNSLTQAQAHADAGLPVILIQNDAPHLSAIIPSQGTLQSNEINVAVVSDENFNCKRIKHSDLIAGSYTVYAHY